MKNVSKQRNDKKETTKLMPKGYGYKIQCLGGRDLLVEGCIGIIQYEQDEIRLNTGTGQISIVGKTLSIPVLEKYFVQIQGCISQIEFI